MSNAFSPAAVDGSETGDDRLLSVDRFTVEQTRRHEEEEVCLRQVSLDLNRAEFLVLAGESGSGVSMLCRWLAAGAVRGSKVLSGEIILEGQPVFELSRRKRRQLFLSKVLYTGRNARSTFCESRTALQNLRDFVTARGLSLRQISANSLHEKLYRVGCIEPERLLETPVCNLAMIDIARLLLLRVLLAEVDLLICDGVTLDFDAVTERQFLEMLVHFQKEERLSLLFSSGKLRGVENFADQVAVFYEGGLLEKGAPSQLIANPEFSYTRDFLHCSPSLLDVPKRLEGISKEAIARAESAIRGEMTSIEP